MLLVSEMLAKAGAGAPIGRGATPEDHRGWNRPGASNCWCASPSVPHPLEPIAGRRCSRTCWRCFYLRRLQKYFTPENCPGTRERGLDGLQGASGLWRGDADKGDLQDSPLR